MTLYDPKVFPYLYDTANHIKSKKKDKFDFGLVKREKPGKDNIFTALIKPASSTEGRK